MKPCMWPRGQLTQGARLHRACALGRTRYRAKAVHEFPQTNRNHPWRAAKKGRAGGGRSLTLSPIQAFLQHWTCREGREREGRDRAIGRERHTHTEREGRERDAGWTLLCRKSCCLRSRRSCLSLRNVVKNVSCFSIRGGALGAQRSGRGRGSLRLFQADVASTAAHPPLKSSKCC